MKSDDFSTRDDWLFEWIIWTTHLSGLVWLIGYFVMIPLGFITSVYLQFVASWNLIEVLIFGKSFEMWVERPLRRMIINTLIFGVSVFAALIPGLSLLIIPWLAWWAVIDYYDYEYQVSPALDEIFANILI